MAVTRQDRRLVNKRLICRQTRIRNTTMSQEHVTHCLCSDGAEATTEDTEVLSSVIFLGIRAFWLTWFLFIQQKIMHLDFTEKKFILHWSLPALTENSNFSSKHVKCHQVQAYSSLSNEMWWCEALLSYLMASFWEMWSTSYLTCISFVPGLTFRQQKLSLNSVNLTCRATELADDSLM